MLNIFLSLLSIGITTFLCLTKNVIHSWIDFYKPLLFFVAFYVLSLLVMLLVLLFIAIFVDRKKIVKKPNAFFIFFFNLFIEFIIFWARIKINTNGIEKIDTTQKYLFVLNHNSIFDTMILSYIFRKNKLVFITKQSNMEIPIVGAFIHECGYLPIDRVNNRNAIKTILESSNNMKKNNIITGICPEGTRNKTDKPLLPFKPGAFKIAKLADVSVAVICLKNTKKIHKNLPFKKTIVDVDILSVINKEEVQAQSTQQLAQISENLILSDLQKDL